MRREASQVCHRSCGRIEQVTIFIDNDMRARHLLRPIRACATDEQYREVVSAVKDALQSAFDLGFKAAGGSIIEIAPVPSEQ